MNIRRGIHDHRATPATRRIALLVLAGLLGGPGLAACSEDHAVVAAPPAAAGQPASALITNIRELEPVATTSPPAHSVEEYCALVAELDRVGSGFFADLERAGASAEQFAAREREFVRTYDRRLTEVVAAAPAEIAEDVATDIRAVRERGGVVEGEPLDRAVGEAAEERVIAFERAHCPRPSATADAGEGK